MRPTLTAALVLMLAVAIVMAAFQPLAAMPTSLKDCRGNDRGHAYPNPQTVGMEKLKTVYLARSEYPCEQPCPPPKHCWLVIIPGGPIYTQCR